MGGDGEGGLAFAIFLASLCIVATPGAVLGAVVFALLKKRSRTARAVAALAAFLLGTGGGVVAMLATFYESTFSPPATLDVVAPPGFRHDWVFLVEDPRATADVTWHGMSGPFMAPHGRVVVPASGVLRVRDVARLEGGDLRATLTDGRALSGRADLAAPAPLGHGRLVALGFGGYPEREPDPGLLAPAALAAHVQALEAGE